MLQEQIWFDFCDALMIELKQSRDEGRLVEPFQNQAEEILRMDPRDPQRKALGKQLLEELEALPVRPDYPYEEPSGLTDIQAVCGTGAEKKPLPSDSVLYDKIYGAWLARCAGCLVGQPVEGWYQGRIIGLMKDTGNYPLNRYISSDISQELREKYDVIDDRVVYGGSKVNWINNVAYMPEDDDTNYTILSLKLLEQYGFDFTPDDVGECWLGNLPILHVCTAERVAYMNLVNQVYPPRSGSYQNAYREYIGAQIRGDLFGYACPGDPRLAAELAWRDASISHVKNGIYGEMFVAAMLAQAAVEDDMTAVIRAGLAQIPAKSRLSEAVEQVFDWKSEGIGWQEAVERIHSIYDETDGYDWCHTISNAMIVCVGLLFGELDLEKTLGICLTAAFDTDCNCATAGSVLGMILGAEKLPEKWIAPLNDQVKSGVDGFGLVKISDMAKRTLALVHR